MIAQASSLGEVAKITGLPPSDLGQLYAWFATTERAVTVYSQGVNQSSAGTDKVNAILNCHLATGRIGRPGMGPFSVTGQPNAMGGRETGGLANMLAAHMELGNAEHRRIVQTHWGAPRIADTPGLKAVDMFRAVADGRIKAIWIMATNPVDSLPEADAVRAALEACPFVVVSDVERHTDTTACADVLLPAAAWGEKDGTVTSSERRISRQRPFLPMPGEARPDWWQLAEVGKRMGFGAAFDYAGPSQIFAEYAALTGAENGGTRDLDISACATMTPSAYDHLQPFQWPRPKGSRPRTTRFFANGGFFTPDGRARFVPTPYRAPAASASADFPLILNTGRLRDQWHTMTRTARAPRLMTHRSEPTVEVHPEDAARFELIDGALAEIESAFSICLARVEITDAQQPGTVFVSLHWTDQLTARGRIDALIAAVTDPVSGQPESKHTPVRARPAPMTWHGFAVTTRKPEVDGLAYFALAATDGGFRVELADHTTPDDWDAAAHRLLGSADQDTCEVLAYHDLSTGRHRYAVFTDERLVAVLFIAREPLTISRTWLSAQIGQPLPAPERLRLLAGRPGAEVRDKGAIVCACLEVGRSDILDAILSQGCNTVAAVGACTKAGTNCGSCRAEIGRLIDDVRLQKAG
jgi:assimilatory nitrate reductase catalytic subunit